MLSTPKHIVPAAILMLTTVAGADQLPSRAALDAILADSEEHLEDFEHVSFHAGSTMILPNPLDSVTGAPLWADLLPGVTYSSSDTLRMYAGFLWGDDSNILWGDGDLTIEFDEPQLAVGFDLDGRSGASYHQVVTMYHGMTVLAETEFDIPPSTTSFFGWQDGAGITSIHIETTMTAGGTPLTEFDNLAWGVTVQPCSADVNTSGVVVVTDLLELLANWGPCEGCAGDLDGNEVIDVQDLLGVLAASGACPG